jgi:uncharacterized membrane protein YgdD (TMEM256/DUF423 family)
MNRPLTLLACVFAFFGVALGAFGAHGLRDRVEPALLEVWQTAVLYQLVHALALLAVALSPIGNRSRSAAALFAAGILIFSGSLYLLVLTGERRFGMATPVGGLSFLLGWALLGYGAWRATEESDRSRSGF